MLTQDIISWQLIRLTRLSCWLASSRPLQSVYFLSHSGPNKHPPMAAMKPIGVHLASIATLLLLAIIVVRNSNSSSDGEISRLSLESTACRLLSNKFVSLNPWTTYPILYAPIKLGRLIVWTGESSLPTSEFKCYAAQGSNSSDILIAFSRFANKLEWTWKDTTKGVTHQGISVNYENEAKFRVTIVGNQNKSYLACNTIERIEPTTSTSFSGSSLKSSCRDCSQTGLAIVEEQIRDLLDTKLREQLIDNLYWHLSQLLTNQHFGSPLSFN